MPPHSRSQRRRQPQRQNTRPQPIDAAPAIDAQEDAEEVADILPVVPAPEPILAVPAQRSTRASRRMLTRPAAEPVDYTKDYAASRRDLTRIIMWSVLLFAAMIALRFSGLV